jgi:hypothetical protein
VTLKMKEFSRFPLTREDARKISLEVPCPERVDFTDVVSVTHCFADELFSRFSPARPSIVNASPFVARIVNAAAASVRQNEPPHS